MSSFTDKEGDVKLLMDKQQRFIRNTIPFAERASAATGIPSQVIMAQWALESGWGESGLAKTGNLGGIKEWGKGKSVTMPTKEVVGGKKIDTLGRFKDFGGDLGAYADAYGKFMSGPRYAKVRAEKDPYKVIEALSRSGYATELPQDYQRKVTGTYETIQKLLPTVDSPSVSPVTNTGVPSDVDMSQGMPGFSMTAGSIAKGEAPKSGTPWADVDDWLQKSVPGGGGGGGGSISPEDIAQLVSQMAGAKGEEEDAAIDSMISDYSASLQAPMFGRFQAPTSYRFPGFFNG